LKNPKLKLIGVEQAVLIAADSNHYFVLKALLGFPGISVQTLSHAITEAFYGREGCRATVELLLQQKDVNVDVSLDESCRLGNLKIVQRFLQVPGIDVTAHQNRALKIAAELGHRDVIKIICYTLSLHILKDFFASPFKDLTSTLKNMSFIDNPKLKALFRQAVITRMGDISGIEGYVEEYIIEKTFKEAKVMQNLTEALPQNFLPEPVAIIWDYCEALEELPQNMYEEQIKNEAETLYEPKNETMSTSRINIPEINSKLYSIHCRQFALLKSQAPTLKRAAENESFGSERDTKKIKINP